MRKPEDLVPILYQDATPEQKREALDFMARVQAEEENRIKNGQPWMFIPDRIEYERMAKYLPDEKCPKCGGRLFVEAQHHSMGSGFMVKCMPGAWHKSGCDFKDDCTNDDRW